MSRSAEATSQPRTRFIFIFQVGDCHSLSVQIEIFTCLLLQFFISGLNIKQTSNKSADFSIKDIETRCSKIFTVDECYKVLALTHFLTRGTFLFIFLAKTPLLVAGWRLSLL